MITPVGPAEIYRGNNRDADGTYRVTRADFTTQIDYFHYLWLDTNLAPIRFIELELRKIGLFLSASEPGNNLNYALSGEAVSPALRYNPLDFRILLALTILGVVVVRRERERSLLAFLAVCAAMMGMTLLIWVEARIRTPIITAMIPCASYGLVYAVERWRQPTFRRRLIPIAVAVTVILSLSWIAENTLPRPATISELPPDVQRMSATYNDELQLVGYRVEKQYSRKGIMQPFYPYVVSFYWKLLRPTQIDYSFALKFLVNGTLIDQYDHPIGYVSYPEQGTSVWEPEVIHVERVALVYKAFDVRLSEVSGNLLLSVYPESESSRLLTATGSEQSYLELARPALVWGSGLFKTLEVPDQNALASLPHFGDVLVLGAWILPTQAQPEETIPVTFGWMTTSQPIESSYAIGIYLMNSSGDFVANFDSPPLNGQLLTFSLPTDYLFEDTRQIVMPSAPGLYHIYVGIYNQESGERLAVTNASDSQANLVLIGEITVK